MKKTIAMALVATAMTAGAASAQASRSHAAGMPRAAVMVGGSRCSRRATSWTTR